jgi:hypothetical protein
MAGELMHGAAGIQGRVRSGAPYNRQETRVDREDLIQFARRDWIAVARAKEQHWLRRRRTAAGRDLCRLSDDLLRYARGAARGRSSDADRLADWRNHQRVGQALRAVTRSAR